MPDLVTLRSDFDHDGFYARLIEAHRGLSAAESAALNARLILILANHVGDDATLARALELATGRGPDGRVGR